LDIELPAIDEATTRKEIDKALAHSGWSPIVRYEPGRIYQHAAVTEFQTSSGPADYVLFHDGRPVAAVEAKREGLAPQNVVGQAERYARDMEESPFEFGKYHIPFVYSTNGHVFWFRDLRRDDSESRQVSGFHTPSALEEMLDRGPNEAEERLSALPLQIPYLRPYQLEAIRHTEDAIVHGRRNMLVAMATGTGKTVVIVALLHRLLKSGVGKRILFLVDRRVLAAQAVGKMAEFEAEPGLKFDRIWEVYSQQFRREDFDENLNFDPKALPTKYLTDPSPGNSFVYVSTIQRMRINLFGRPGEETALTGDEDVDESAERLDIPIHAFDYIIADECHRGYTAQEDSKWRAVLSHFDAVRIGLTATPAAHTTAFFRNIVYRYSYDEAVREGYLVDYDPVIIDSHIRMNGVFLHEGEEVELVDRQTGRTSFDNLEDEREFDVVELERKVTVPDSNLKIVREYLKHANDFERSTGHFPKTIVFASNDLPHTSHSDLLVRLLREECGKGDAFVQKITASPTVDRPLQRIREFRNRKLPAIAVTVDMLTTGVDIPAVEALLFVRPVKSRILFEQMLGRGTRKCEDISKSHFIVFDSVGVLEFFRNASAFTTEPPAKPSRSVGQIVGDIRNNVDREYNIRTLAIRLQRVARTVSAEGRDLFSNWIPDGDIQGFAARLPTLLEQEWGRTIAILEDDDFQTLVADYPRAPHTFIVAHEEQDVVTSTYHIRTADGRELKPNDYIRIFEEYVRKNPDHVEALSILLERPSDFNTNALSELRKKLAGRPEKFTEENLRRAYNQELADIISIVRHATTGSPLYSSTERVDRAMQKIRSGRQFTQDQENWLQLIRNHLVRNLLIEKGHFDSIPFSRHGGWKKAETDFDNELESLLSEINEAVLV
jgi:type I restriction enzyme R subunit